MDKTWSRMYVIAQSDISSHSKVEEFEKEVTTGTFSISYIPRSRHVHQSWLTTPFTTLYSTFKAISLILKTNPQVLICNGPGTCIPLCLVAKLFTILGISSTKILFIESFARVKDLSLTGKILYRLADRVVVQWEELCEKYPNASYLGQLM